MKREVHRGRRSVAAATLLLAMTGFGASPPALAAAGSDPGVTTVSMLPDCPQPWRATPDAKAAALRTTWHALLDAHGWLAGYQLGLGGAPGHTYRVAASAFRERVDAHSVDHRRTGPDHHAALPAGPVGGLRHQPAYPPPSRVRPHRRPRGRGPGLQRGRAGHASGAGDVAGRVAIMARAPAAGAATHGQRGPPPSPGRSG